MVYHDSNKNTLNESMIIIASLGLAQLIIDKDFNQFIFGCEYYKIT